MNSSPVVAVNCDNRKAMENEKWHRATFQNSTKNDNIEFRKKKLTKWKSNLKSIKSQNVSSYYVKNGKVITINFLIITVTIKIIVKMNNNNKQIIIFLSKETNTDSE